VTRILRKSSLPYWDGSFNGKEPTIPRLKPGAVFENRCTVKDRSTLKIDIETGKTGAAMRCPHCQERNVRRHTCRKTGRWYLWCETCKVEVMLVESNNGAWRDLLCPECGETVRHDVIKVLAICRLCNRVVELRGMEKER